MAFVGRVEYSGGEERFGGPDSGMWQGFENPKLFTFDKIFVFLYFRDFNKHKKIKFMIFFFSTTPLNPIPSLLL